MIELVRGSVLEQDVEAIVNAANTALQGGGGLDGAVHKAAGPGLLEELRRVAPGGCRTGRAVVTGGHKAGFKAIIHTAGPVWQGGKSNEEELLTSCYRNSLLAASEAGVVSIAIPSISTGVYRFPLALAAPIAVASVRAFISEAQDSALRRFVFAMYGAQEYEAFRVALAQAGAA